MAGRFIKLYDKILKWEWYKNVNVKVLFLHLLLKANYKDLYFEGRKILRGQLVTSLPSLSAELGLTTRQIRGSLEHLISTGEVTSSAYPRYRVITIVHYDDYQEDGSRNGSQTAGERAAKGQSNGSQRAASIEYIEHIEQDRNIESLSTRERSAKRFVPPSPDEVRAYCQENGIQISADRFVDYYTSKGWLVGKSPMKDWKAAVRGWAKRDQEQQNQAPAPAPAQSTVKKVIAQDFDQRDYSGNQEYWENRMRQRLMERRRQNENI